MIDFAIGRIDIFLVHTLGTTVEHTAAKSHHLSAHAEPWEDGAPREAVEILVLPGLVASLVLVYLETQARIYQVFRIIPLLHRLVIERRALGKSETQLEFPDNVIAKATTAEILHADGPSVHVVVKNVLKIFRSPLVDDVHRLALILPLLLLVGQLTLLDLNVIFLGEPAQGIGISHLLQLHQEVDGISALAAGKTMADAPCRGNGERRMGIVVERAQTDVIDTTLLERDELRHHLFYLGGVHNPGYGRLVYHKDFCTLECKDNTFYREKSFFNEKSRFS